MLQIEATHYNEGTAVLEDDFDGLPEHIAADQGAGDASHGWKRFWQRNLAKMNDEQKRAFDAVKCAIEQLRHPTIRTGRRLLCGEPNLFFLEGAGGTGSSSHS